MDGAFAGYQERGSEGIAIVPLVRYFYGLSDHLDLGLITEFKSFSPIVKVTFTEPEAGFSFAAIAQVTAIREQISYAVGGIASYKAKAWEPFLAVKFVRANYDNDIVDNAFFEDSPDLQFHFISTAFGLLYWLRDDVALGVEANFLHGNDASANFSVEAIPSFYLAMVF